MNEIYLNGRLIIKTGDITEENADAIVNAANYTLLGGGGVDGAIHSKGGSEILRECEQIRKTEYPNGLPTGKAVITTAGDLPARYVIHTVGPIYGNHNGREAELLRDCYLNSITLASENNLGSIAFPAISTGAFGYPMHEAAKIVGETLKTTLKDLVLPEKIILIFFSISDTKMFIRHTRSIFL